MNSKTPHLSLGKIFLRAALLTVGFLFVGIILTLLVMGFFAKRYISAFEAAGNTSISELKQIVETGVKLEPKRQSGNTVFLILGTDSLTLRGDVPPLTDTILLVSVNYDSGEINQLSVPRDLWSDAYKTKVNALFSYGPDHTPEKPEQFPAKAISELVGVPIDYTVVVDMNTIATIVDSLGGVTVNVESSFTDTEFPNSNVDVTTVTDPKLLYRTISFETGPEQMNGERFLEYIRSRHSESEEGTDDARSRRQQKALSALMDSTKQRSLLTDPNKLGNLYKLYSNSFSQYLSIEEAVSIGYKFRNQINSLEINNHSLSILTESEPGVLTHPNPRYYENQWVYTIVSEENFKKEVQQKLGITKHE
ncbi:MAG: hypothetical protein COU65_01080 [Candidatus Pacebacteria bacterium CG10_big_fil_rev_8_21_14_0_10_42_12]|nr:MAG: hypothetical protein COU65_01080 [Candidatus Pacebacteria bacterium CG10_big_fil_rev_8_21_14_0_10_42_12]